MKIHNKTTGEIEELNLNNEFVSDMTDAVIISDENFSFNTQLGRWEANAETIEWWRKVEADNEKFAAMLMDNNISILEFCTWAFEQKRYVLSSDVDLAEKEKIKYLEEMIKERKNT